MGTGLKVATFKQRFAVLFDESEKTITELAKELRVSNQTISAWKTGTRSPKEPTIIAIANYFGVSVEWLMGFDVEKVSQADSSRPLDLQFFGSKSKEPKTTEAKILAAGIDKLPKEQREQALNVVKAMFMQYADYFEKGSESDDT